jgi:hypothetical protein
MSDLGWREAVVKVLEESGGPMHYADIADTIVEQKLRISIGATPATSVNVVISDSIKNDGVKSPFVRVDRGVYGLRGKVGLAIASATPEEAVDEKNDDTGLINAFGMYWSRSNVLWSPVAPRILGQLRSETESVDFYAERGVYMLHDGRSVVYVGRTTDQPLGLRLRQHTFDRLNGRWDRFSWFGTSRVNEAGRLEEASDKGFNQELLIVTMEALLIEALEPPQNRKRGDDFRAIEFLQFEDPEIRKKNLIALMDEMKSKL